VEPFYNFHSHTHGMVTVSGEPNRGMVEAGGGPLAAESPSSQEYEAEREVRWSHQRILVSLSKVSSLCLCVKEKVGEIVGPHERFIISKKLCRICIGFGSMRFFSYTVLFDSYDCNPLKFLQRIHVHYVLEDNLPSLILFYNIFLGFPCNQTVVDLKSCSFLIL
jgi:hypothetical protein